MDQTMDVDVSTLMFIDRPWLEHHTMNVRRHLLTERKVVLQHSLSYVLSLTFTFFSRNRHL